jgi:hypothetical protein
MKQSDLGKSLDPTTHRDRKNVVYSQWCKHRYMHNRTVANISELSLRRCQYRRAFIAPLPTEKNNIVNCKNFSAPLATDSKFVHSAIANSCK